MASSQPPSSPVSSGATPSADPSAPVPEVPFDEKLRQFWARNRKIVVTVCVVALAAIVAKGAMEILQEQREKGVMADYAKATSDAQLKTFAAAHDSHLLGGVAYLRLADEAFTAGKYSDAISLYGKAVPALKTSILSHRAVMGGAVAKVLSGDRAGGEAAFKAIVSDLSQPVSTRAEATYQLAVMASTASDDTSLQGYVTQLSTLSPQSIWAQRAVALRAEAGLPAAAGASQPSATPAASAAESDAPKVTFPSTK
ncbi:MAG: hypothetical protein KBA71_09700 [Opitutaceae bacterium]|nr:hypothetical protein [Opitutaceae bacterium]